MIIKCNECLAPWGTDGSLEELVAAWDRWIIDEIELHVSEDGWGYVAGQFPLLFSRHDIEIKPATLCYVRESDVKFFGELGLEICVPEPTCWVNLTDYGCELPEWWWRRRAKPGWATSDCCHVTVRYHRSIQTQFPRVPHDFW